MSLTVSYVPENQSGPFDCACCEGRSWTVWAYVDGPDGPHAVYFFGFTERHEVGQIAVGVGGWGEGADLSERAWICYWIKLVDGRLARQVQEPSDGTIAPTGSGRVLGVAEVEALPSQEPWLDVIRAGIAQDPRMQGFLVDGRGLADGGGPH